MKFTYLTFDNVALFNGFWVILYSVAVTTTNKIILNVREEIRENKLDSLIVFLNIVLPYP